MLGGDPVVEALDQVLLAGEVVVRVADGDPGLLGVVPHGRPVVTAFLEEPHGRLQDQRAGLLGLAEGAPSSGPSFFAGTGREPNEWRRCRRRSRVRHGSTPARFVGPPVGPAVPVAAPLPLSAPPLGGGQDGSPGQPRPGGRAEPVGERAMLAQRPQDDDPGGGAPEDLPGVPDDGDLVKGDGVVEAGKPPRLVRPGRDQLQRHQPRRRSSQSRTWVHREHSAS